MKLSCGVMEDLLPLYVDGGCTEETAAAVEEHLGDCPDCRKTYEQMSSAPPKWEQEPAPEEKILQKYSQKVRKNKRFRGFLIALIALCCLLAGGLTALTIHTMYRQEYPVVFEVGDGVWNLTAGELSVPAGETEEYALFTNYTQIQVDVIGVSTSDPVTGTVYLYNAASSEPILQFRVDEQTQSGCFTGLSSEYRYIVEVDCDQEAQVTISEGRETDFFSCFGMVVNELLSALLH